MDENAILDAAYAMYEGDTDDWSTTGDEYLAARRYANAAITMWKNYDNSKWSELFTSLSDASDGDKTTDGTNQYDCPTNFNRLSSWVRVGTGTSPVWYQPIQNYKIGKLASSSNKFCYILGNPKDGYTLNFNANITISSGDTLAYEYYKNPTEFASTTDETEMQNPYFMVHYILHRMYDNDGEDSKSNREFALAQQLLEQMRVDNMQDTWDTPFTVETDPTTDYGFGI